MKERALSVFNWLASTRASLGVIGLVLAVIAITTLTNDSLEGLPLPNILAAATGAGAVAGISGAVLGASSHARRYTGAALMIVAALRGFGLAVVVVKRTDGFVEFLKQSNGPALWTLAFYFGFLVWARANAPEYHRSRKGG